MFINWDGLGSDAHGMDQTYLLGVTTIHATWARPFQLDVVDPKGKENKRTEKKTNGCFENFPN